MIIKFVVRTWMQKQKMLHNHVTRLVFSCEECNHEANLDTLLHDIHTPLYVGCKECRLGKTKIPAQFFTL